MIAKKCKHCGESIEYENNSQFANHVRWCKQNPKRQQYLNTLSKVRTTNNENQFTKARKNGQILHHSEETKEKLRQSNIGKKHTKETKEKIRKIALSQTHRRLKKGVVEYNGVIMDSSWEVELAKRLDSLNIEWIRPEPIKWTDKNNVKRNYFPDFYLPKYDLYIDPKNQYAHEVQKDKIEILLETYDNILILNTLEECKQFMPRPMDTETGLLNQS